MLKTVGIGARESIDFQTGVFYNLFCRGASFIKKCTLNAVDRAQPNLLP